MRRTRVGSVVAVLASSWALGCNRSAEPVRRDAAPTQTQSGATVGSSAADRDAAPPLADAAAPGDAAPSPDEDPMTGHYERLEDLLALVPVRDASHVRKNGGTPEQLLAATFGLGSPSHMNQGNKALAHHAIARARCLAGLEGAVLQTEEQKQRCGGIENMVPIYKKGKRERARTCIDVFEFPNRACELPVVWASPIQAAMICQLEGKRLCTQEEWILACRGDPEGVADRKYAYGDELDLDVCNTNKRSGSFKETTCDPDSARSAWKTCGTNTEPAGAYAGCRSRFGVFDQHGNVAEIMTRLDEDGHVYSQLKGSAFFYVDVARKELERPPKDRETYPDTCAHDPRWHVEPMEAAWHVNYHLGFRCCRTIHP